MKRTRAVVVPLLLVPALLLAQPRRQRVIMSDSTGPSSAARQVEGVLSIPELSAVIGEDGGRMVVDHVMEPGMRPKGYEKTDVQEGDVLLMADGKKMNTLKDARDHYEAAAAGSTVKLGFRRNEQMLIASFVKADPREMPKVRMMVSHGGPETDMLGVPQVGLRFGSRNKLVVIQDVLPNAATRLPGADVREGDVVTKLNGETVSSFREFARLYERVAAGARIELSTSRKDSSQTVSFAKPEDTGRVIIRR